MPKKKKRRYCHDSEPSPVFSRSLSEIQLQIGCGPIPEAFLKLVEEKPFITLSVEQIRDHLLQHCPKEDVPSTLAEVDELIETARNGLKDVCTIRRWRHQWRFRRLS